MNDHDGQSHAGHSHGSNANESKVLIAFVITFSFMVVEAVGGAISGSLALIADAGHMLTDAMSLALAYGAFRLGRKPADIKRTFGYGRFEVIAGFLNALTLFIIFFWIVYEAVKRFTEPKEILTGPMFIVASIGLVVNIAVYWYLTRGDSEHVNIKGAALHVMGDLLGSIGAIAASIAIYFTGWTPIDPLLSVFVSLLILNSAWRLLKNSLHILLEGAPSGLSASIIETHILETIPTVAKVKHVHIWSLTSGSTLATMHIALKPAADPRSTVKSVEQELDKKFGIQHATIAIDWDDVDSQCAVQ
ncbi:cation diffusion facilitator family transporter [Oxalicibacterium faecigallinarum]|uniref:Cation efflux protein n=1 Tax=Oxalicibacterium faecigallinarum TaxID=573741 RepID=A0A8J3AVK2_9BURK|nr:cation diffusion facilitator family transporter [Oxalicibacterium faecigallinarum]GGI17013.1 cation efflux protein [Oxalicibacterium faecigallinarum]